MCVKNATQHMHVKYESLGAKIIIMGDFCGKKMIPFFKKNFKLFVVFKRIRIKTSGLRSPSDNRPRDRPFPGFRFCKPDLCSKTNPGLSHESADSPRPKTRSGPPWHYRKWTGSKLAVKL